MKRVYTRMNNHTFFFFLKLNLPFKKIYKITPRHMTFQLVQNGLYHLMPIICLIASMANAHGLLCSLQSPCQQLCWCNVSNWMANWFCIVIEVGLLHINHILVCTIIAQIFGAKRWEMLKWHNFSTGVEACLILCYFNVHAYMDLYGHFNF